MLTVIDLREDPERLADATARADTDAADVIQTVRAIIEEVREGGDAALRALTERFDGVVIDAAALRADAGELEEAWAAADSDLQDALGRAAERIRRYHGRIGAGREHREEGITVEEREIPVARAGIYVPGGRADYPSTVLMTAIPAQAAEVPEIALCVPPDSEGRVPAMTAAAAHLLGLAEVYKVGGAQAIAALAYGTETICPVDKIVGPGNIYVALAKVEVARDVGVESLAGPSECVILADSDARPEVVAVDLVAQAEHGPGGLCVLVTWSDALADAVADETDKLVDASPRRGEILSTLEGGGRIVLCDGPEAAVKVANLIAPEHLELMVADADDLLPLVRNAGAIFCGYDTPITLGDYAAGPSHVLPTGGTARFASALRREDFIKTVHVVTASSDGLRAVGAIAMAIADAEGLDAHAEAVRVRLRADTDRTGC